MNFLISAGHDKNHTGASNRMLNLTEYEVNEAVVKAIETLFSEDERLEGHKLTILNHKNSDDLKAVIRKVNSLHKKTPFDLIIEVHFNASLIETKKGIEVLYASERGRIYADIFFKHIGEKTCDTRNRIYDPLDDYEAYYLFASGHRKEKSKSEFIKGFLHKTEPVALITESGYITNNQTARRLKDPDYIKRIAMAHIESVVEIIENEQLESLAEDHC
jgi:N-acetylmuramoyl-L-alanine amidase